MTLLRTARGGPAAAGGRSDRGDTFVEVLFAILLLATVVLVIVEAFLVAAQQQRGHRAGAQAETAARAFVENLQSRATTFYKPCANAVTPATFGTVAAGDNLTVAVSDVAFWKKDTSPAQFDPSCANGVPDLLRLGIRVTDSTNAIVQSFSVVLRTAP